jgi:tetratricopeptide (TPR) repeat protein
MKKNRKCHPRGRGDQGRLIPGRLIPAFAGITLVFMLFVTRVMAAAEPPLFQQANSKYQGGDFKGASEIYQKLIQTGPATAVLYYNLGNATLKSGEKGAALVYYERALKAAPRDKDIRWNLNVLKAALPDKIEDNSYFLIAGSRELMSYVTPDELAILLSALLAWVALLNSVYFFFPVFISWTGWMRKLGLFGLGVVALLLAWKVWETKDPHVVVLDKEVYAFYGPSDRETKAFLLHEGALGKVTDTTDDWVYLTLPNKKSGWIRKNACETI